MFSSFSKKSRGFGLLETVIGVAVFLIIALSVWQAFGVILNGVKVLRIKSAAINLANEQIEIIRNLPYSDVGIVQGLPAGKIPREQILNRNDTDFIVTTTIRNIDDPFDGVIGGTPNDLSPADNKLVKVEVVCQNGCNVPAISLTTRVAPVALETTGNNGALFIQVFDSNGLPLSNVNVHIEKNAPSPAIVIDDKTDVNGMLQIVDAPPATEAYKITVSKTGYSSDRTYANGEVDNPVPNKLHANVASGQVTQVSFTIDKVSNLTINSKTSECSNISALNFQMTGSKTIGLDTFKYSKAHSTNGSGTINLNNIEWDSYSFVIDSLVYMLAGTNPIIPLDIFPNSTQSIDLILEPSNPNALLVKVVDLGSGLPLADANVTLTKGPNTFEALTGLGSMLQTDWSGGGGQENLTNNTRYLSDDGNIEVNNSSGEIKLVNFGGGFVGAGELISSTFDVATSTNFDVFEWLPGSQPAQTGSDSVRFQVATNVENTATTTWDFVGPDGTVGSYFTSSGQSFHSSHNGDRYLRYKVLFNTVDTNHTPSISEISFTFSTACTPAGQAYFDGLPSGQYNISVTKPGYQNYIYNNFPVTSDWQKLFVQLTP